MSTESPLITDGSQCIAAANYGNGANLAGTNTAGTTGGATGSGQFLCVGLTSGTSRSVTLATAAGQQIYGILQNKPALGDVANVAIFGVTKAVAGGTITAGAAVMAASTGAVIAWTSTGNKAQIGYAIEAAVSGQVFAMFLGNTGNTTA